MVEYWDELTYAIDNQEIKGVDVTLGSTDEGDIDADARQ